MTELFGIPMGIVMWTFSIALGAINFTKAGAGIQAPPGLQSEGERPPPQTIGQVIVHAFP